MIICKGVSTVICCISAGGTSVWVVDMGYVPAHWEYSGRLPQQGYQQVDGSSSKEEEVWEVDITPNAGGDRRGIYTGSGDLCRPPPEYWCTINCDQVRCGPVFGGGAVTNDKGFASVVEA